MTSRGEDELSRNPAVVIGGGAYGGYDIVRAFGKAGGRSIVASSIPRVASLSRYACGTLILPDFKEKYLDEIRDRLIGYASRNTGRPVLFYTGAREAAFTARYRDELASFYRFLLPPQRILDAIADKIRFVELAKSAGLPVPRARVFSSAKELDSALRTIEMPCIVKPARGSDWETEPFQNRFPSYKRSLRRFHSRADVRDFCSQLPADAGFIVQSWVHGEQSVTCFHGFFDETSRCLASFLTRDIRTIPRQMGDTTFSETFHDEELTRSSCEYLRRLEFQGIAKIDYKWDVKRGRYTILEIEPHYHVWHLLGAFAGVNLPAVAWRYLQGQRPIEPLLCRPKVRLLWFSRDVWTFLKQYRRTGEWNWTQYIKSVMGPAHYRLFDIRDPLPMIGSVNLFLKRKVTKAVRQLHRSLSDTIWKPAANRVLLLAMIHAALGSGEHP